MCLYRRFTYGHLGQLKYVLPEAISIKKVLLRDEATCCMKPELQVYLQTDAIGSGLKRREESGYSILRKVFRQRLVNFSRENPEVLCKAYLDTHFICLQWMHLMKIMLWIRIRLWTLNSVNFKLYKIISAYLLPL